MSRAFLDAWAASGHRRVSDHNAPWAIGAGPLPVNTLGGIRQSIALTYLAQARTRPNLTIRSGALVDRLVVEGGHAIGVRLAEPDETLPAERMILAAGSFGSPAILLRSGVGPSAELTALGIAVVAEAPGMGANLIDHPDDLAGLLAGVRIARRVARTAPLAGLLGEERYLGAAVADQGPALEAAVRADVDTYFHPVGTCRMGSRGDPWAVVDNQGRVHGIGGCGRSTRRSCRRSRRPTPTFPPSR